MVVTVQYNISIWLKKRLTACAAAWIFWGAGFNVLPLQAATFVGISQFHVVSNASKTAGSKATQQPLVLQFETDLPLSYSLSVPNTHTVVLQLHEARFLDGLFSNGQLPVAQLPAGVTRVAWMPAKSLGTHGQLTLVGPKLAQRRLLVQGATPMEWPVPNTPTETMMAQTTLAPSGGESGFSLQPAADTLADTHTEPVTSLTSQQMVEEKASFEQATTLPAELKQEPLDITMDVITGATEPIAAVLQSLQDDPAVVTTPRQAPEPADEAPVQPPESEALRPLLPPAPSMQQVSQWGEKPSIKTLPPPQPRAEEDSLTYTVVGGGAEAMPAHPVYSAYTTPIASPVSPEALPQPVSSKAMAAVVSSFEAQDWPKTHQQLLDLLKKSPRQAALWALLGELYLATHQPEDAAPAFEQALALEPSVVTQGVYIDRWAVSLYQWPDGLNAWEHWQAMAPSWASVIQQHYLANTVGGSLAAAAGQTDVAVDYWQRATQLDPTSVEAHTQLALALELQQRPSEALVHYQTASRLNPLDDASRLGLARLTPVASGPLLQGVPPQPATMAAVEEPKKSKGGTKGLKPSGVSRLPIRFQRPPAFDAGGFRPF